MERTTNKNGLINLVVLLLVGAAAFAVARLTNSLAGLFSTVFVSIGVLISAVSWFQMRLAESERLERLELEELTRSKGSSTLFEAKDAEIFPAQRSREQFERFFVPVFTGLLFIAEAIGAYLLWKWLSHGSTVVSLKQPLVALALFGLFALILFLLGKFSATVARIENHRLLRPGAGWLLLCAYLCFAVAMGVVMVEAGFPKADFYVARGLAVLLGLVAAETLISLILEIYRPRVKGKITQPLYESRIVGLLGHPEGLLTTAAQALDYQFGFKVSDTWFFQQAQKYLPLLLLAQLLVLLVSTTVVFIEPGEQGLLERFGRPVENRQLLNPGPHWKYPWPIDKVHRYRTEQIQSFDVGFTPDPKVENQPAVLWTVAHSKEENFLVANRDPSSAFTNTVSGRRAPPVSLLTVSIPVHFQITNLLEWAYNNDNPAKLLQDIATREVVRYLGSADLNEVMSRERSAAGEALRNRIQAAEAAHKLGVNIVFVGLQDIHPPVKVAPDYEKVISTSHQQQTKILAARAGGIRTNALAEAQATDLMNRAASERVTREINAIAQAALFTNQVPAYQAAPGIYMNRTYLKTFARATAGARKYVVLTTNSHSVYQLDLQDKIREDLLNLNVTPQN